MKLSLINENNLKARIIDAYTRGGIQGIADEFNCDIGRAYQYIDMFGGGTYGEVDIDDKVLHRLRAPQNILRLLRYFDISPNIVSKLMSFYKSKRTTNRPNAGEADDRVYELVMDGEKLVGMVASTDLADQLGLVASNAPYPNQWYISKPENTDVVDELNRVSDSNGVDSLASDMFRGLAFGYSLQNVYNFVRHKDSELVDKICGGAHN